MSPKTPERHVAARIDHDHVALLHVVEHVAVELLLGIGVFALAEEVRRACGMNCSVSAGPTIDLPLFCAHRADHVRVAEAHVAERAGDGRGADILERVDHVLAAGA